MSKLKTAGRVAFAIGLCVGAAVAGNGARGRIRVQSAPAITPIPPDPSHDIGTGERLLLAIGGEYSTHAEAANANERFNFGDMRGFTVAPSDDFEGLKRGRWLLLSAFRTKAGANDFASLAHRAGASHVRLAIARYLGTRYIGLGQEMRPDGTGPLIGPLPEDDPNRIG